MMKKKNVLLLKWMNEGGGIMKKIIVKITKDGKVNLEAQCFQGQECMNNKKIRKIIELLKNEGFIENIELQGEENEKEKQKNEIEEQYW